MRSKVAWMGEPPEQIMPGVDVRREPCFEDMHPPISGRSHPSRLINMILEERSAEQGSVILFTAVDAGCGVSYIASHVALDLASLGERVLLADATILTQSATHADPLGFCRRLSTDGVWVLANGQVPNGKPDASIKPVAMRETCRLLTREFSCVILDAPATSDSDVALRVAALADHLVLVVQQDKTNTSQLVRTHQRFLSRGARVSGFVYNAHP